MTTLLAAALITHVITGVLALGMHNVAVMHLLKKTPNFIFLTRLTWSAAALFFISWASAAYYYVTYYGTAVKPRILEGAMPAAHTFFMETKEHIFLLLPFMALSIALSVNYMRHNPDDLLQRSTAALSFASLVIGAAVAAFGIVASGSI